MCFGGHEHRQAPGGPWIRSRGVKRIGCSVAKYLQLKRVKTRFGVRYQMRSTGRFVARKDWEPTVKASKRFGNSGNFKSKKAKTAIFNILLAEENAGNDIGISDAQELYRIRMKANAERVLAGEPEQSIVYPEVG